MSREKTITSKSIYSGRAIELRVDTVEMPDGRRTTREIVEHSPVIVVIAVDDHENVLLVRQYRTPVEKELLELPAGGIEKDEKPDEAVCREMQEETGFLPRKVVRLGGFYSAPGFCTEYLHLFLATDLVQGRLHAEDTDEISVVRVPVDEISTMLASSTFEDAKSIAGLYMYLAYRSTKH